VPDELELGTGESQLVELEVDVPDGLPLGTFLRLSARVGVAEDDPRENTTELVRLVDEDVDGDGVASVLERGPSGDIVGYDGNGDGQPDAEQSTVLSLPLFASQYATLEVPSTLEITALERDLLTPEASLPEEAVLPLGVFRLSARPGRGETREISLYLPDASPYPFQGLAAAQVDGPWRLSGGFEAGSQRFRALLTDGASEDLDTSRTGLSFVLGPAYGFPREDEPAGCACRATPRGQSPSIAIVLFALAGLALRRRRVRTLRPQA
jgi:MYXO-CTERM domain-containing protein